MGIRLLRAADYDDMSHLAAEQYAEQLHKKPDSLLGLATGSTPIGLYRRLAEACKNGDLDFSGVRTVNLDEYVGLPADHPQSYRFFMDSQLFLHINIPYENTHVPNGAAPDPEEECRRYDRLLAALGDPDIQLLGIGVNGHIGFNEPSDCFRKETHLAALKEKTRKSNARFFSSADEVPKAAITMGIGAIMNARRIVLLASGAEKAAAVRGTLFGPITPSLPASILQLHRDVLLIADEAALSELPAAP